MDSPPAAQPPKPAPQSPTGAAPRPGLRVAQRMAPLQDTSSRSAQAGELAGDIGYKVKRFFAEQIDDLRASDRYFKLKAAIVVAWAVLTVVSLVVARSGGTVDPSRNELGAYVRVNKTSLGWGLLLHNTTDEAWTSCNLTLNGAFVLERAMIAPGEKAVLGTGQFLKDGKPAPPTEEPKTLRVACAEGATTPTLAR